MLAIFTAELTLLASLCQVSSFGRLISVKSCIDFVTNRYPRNSMHTSCPSSKKLNSLLETSGKVNCWMVKMCKVSVICFPLIKIKCYFLDCFIKLLRNFKQITPNIFVVFLGSVSSIKQLLIARGPWRIRSNPVMKLFCLVFDRWIVCSKCMPSEVAVTHPPYSWTTKWSFSNFLYISGYSASRITIFSKYQVHIACNSIYHTPWRQKLSLVLTENDLSNCLFFQQQLIFS